MNMLSASAQQLSFFPV